MIPLLLVEKTPIISLPIHEKMSYNEFLVGIVTYALYAERERGDGPASLFPLVHSLSLPFTSLCLIIDGVLGRLRGTDRQAEAEAVGDELRSVRSLARLVSATLRIVVHPPPPSLPPHNQRLAQPLTTIPPDCIDLSTLTVSPVQEILASLAAEFATDALYLSLAPLDADDESDEESDSSAGTESEGSADGEGGDGEAHLRSCVWFPFSVWMPAPSQSGPDVQVTLAIDQVETAAQVKDRLRATYALACDTETPLGDESEWDVYAVHSSTGAILGSISVDKDEAVAAVHRHLQEALGAGGVLRYYYARKEDVDGGSGAEDGDHAAPAVVEAGTDRASAVVSAPPSPVKPPPPEARSRSGSRIAIVRRTSSRRQADRDHDRDRDPSSSAAAATAAPAAATPTPTPSTPRLTSPRAFVAAAAASSALRAEGSRINLPAGAATASGGLRFHLEVELPGSDKEQESVSISLDITSTHKQLDALLRGEMRRGVGRERGMANERPVGWRPWAVFAVDRETGQNIVCLADPWVGPPVEVAARLQREREESGGLASVRFVYKRRDDLATEEGSAADGVVVSVTLSPALAALSPTATLPLTLYEHYTYQDVHDNLTDTLVDQCPTPSAREAAFDAAASSALVALAKDDSLLLVVADVFVGSPWEVHAQLSSAGVGFYYVFGQRSEYEEEREGGGAGESHEASEDAASQSEDDESGEYSYYSYSEYESDVDEDTVDFDEVDLSSAARAVAQGSADGPTHTVSVALGTGSSVPKLPGVPLAPGVPHDAVLDDIYARAAAAGHTSALPARASACLVVRDEDGELLVNLADIWIATPAEIHSQSSEPGKELRYSVEERASDGNGSGDEADEDDGACTSSGSGSRSAPSSPSRARRKSSVRRSHKTSRHSSRRGTSARADDEDASGRPSRGSRRGSRVASASTSSLARTSTSASASSSSQSGKSSVSAPSSPVSAAPASVRHTQPKTPQPPSLLRRVALTAAPAAAATGASGSVAPSSTPSSNAASSLRVTLVDTTPTSGAGSRAGSMVAVRRKSVYAPVREVSPRAGEFAVVDSACRTPRGDNGLFAAASRDRSASVQFDMDAHLAELEESLALPPMTPRGGGGGGGGGSGGEVANDALPGGAGGLERTTSSRRRRRKPVAPGMSGAEVARIRAMIEEAGGDKGTAELHQMLGTALLDAADDVDAALGELRIAVDLDPSNAEMQVDLSRALMAKGRYDSAVHHLHRALELDPSAAAVIYTNLGSCRASAGRFEHAAKDLEKAVAEASSSESVLYSASLTLASVYRHLNRTTAALEALERCSRLQPDAVLPHLRAAEVLEQANSYVAALNRAGKAQELAVAQGDEVLASDAARLLGSLSEKLGNGDAALQHYERALQAEPDSVPLLVYIGSLLEEQARASGSTDRAGMPYLERACELDSMNGSANNALAVAYGRLRRFAEGRERAERAVVLASRQLRKASASMDVERARNLLANTHSNAGYLSRECGALGAAISHFEASLKLQQDNGDSDTWNKLGQAYAQKKLVSRALECFRRASEADPSDARVHYNAAAINANLVATKQGIERAINHAKRAVELDEGFEEAQHMLRALLDHKAKKGW